MSKSPLSDRLLSNSPDPIKFSIMRDSGMGWISPTSNPGSRSSGTSDSLTSPLRISKRDSPRILPQAPLARRSSSSYKHVRNNNLVSKSPFKSQVPPPSAPTSRPISFPSPRRVSGEKRARPSSIHDQAESENSRPFALKRERRQSKTFQGLIQKEPVTKSPFRQPVMNTEEQHIPRPLPLTHLLSTPAPVPHSQPIPSSNGVSPGRSSLVSRRMHGPRLSSGSRNRRGRRKTVTWDESCDVVEISADEHDSHSETAEDNSIEIDGPQEELDDDPFFRGALGVEAPEDSSYESNDLDRSGGDGSSMMGLGLDPDASISGLVEEIFASSNGISTAASQTVTTFQIPAIATSTPPRSAASPRLPPELETEDGVPLGRSHHATRFLQHQRGYSQSPKPSPPHFPSYSSAHSSPQQLANALAFKLPTQASPHGPPATPPRRSAAPSPSVQISHNIDTVTETVTSTSMPPAASPNVPSPELVTKVTTGHLATPPLGRSTHAERSQLAKEDGCDDVSLLPGTPSPSKSTRHSGPTEDGLIPRFTVEIGSSNILSTSSEDPFAFSDTEHSVDISIKGLAYDAHHDMVDELLSSGGPAALESVEETSQINEDGQYLGANSPTLESQPSFALDDHFLQHATPPSTLSDSSAPNTPHGVTVMKQCNTSGAHCLEDSGRFSVVTSVSEDIKTDNLSSPVTMTDVDSVGEDLLTSANVVEDVEFGYDEARTSFQLDFGSEFGRGLAVDNADYEPGNLSLTTPGADTVKEKTPSIQSGGSMKMGDVDVDMDMRSALDRLMDDVAGTQADESVMSEECDPYEILQPARPAASDPRPMERAVTDSTLLHNNFVHRNVSVSSASSIPPLPPPKDNIKSREQMILERRREARRAERDEFTPPETGGGLAIGRPSRRRSMSANDAQAQVGITRGKGDVMLEVPGVGRMGVGDKEFGDSIEEELKRMVAPPKNQTKYQIREHEGTIYASSSGPDIIEHMAGPGDVNVGKAWRAVRRPSDMNEYSKQIKEYRAQEKLGKAYGKVFVKVLGVKGIHVPLPEQSTAITCTLNNGIHFVTTPECHLGKDFRIEQEFELIEHNKLEFTLTLKVRRDPHIITQFKELVPAQQVPVPSPQVVPTSTKGTSSKGGMRSFFSSSPKKSSKERLPVHNPVPQPQPVQRLPENLARYLKPDGTMARAFISFKDIASRCDTRLFETSYPLIGQRVEAGGKISTLQVGEIVLQLFRLPALPGIPPDQLPQSLEECTRGLRHINWHKVTYFEGILTQSGGDCSTWRRRQLRVIGANLVAFNDITKKATATIDLKKAIAVEDNQEMRNSALSPGGTSRYHEDDGLYGVERSFRLSFPHDQEILFFADTDEEKARWLDVLRALVGHIPPHPFWAEILWQRQEELTKVVQSPPSQSSPSWLVSRGPQVLDP